MSSEFLLAPTRWPKSLRTLCTRLRFWQSNFQNQDVACKKVAGSSSARHKDNNGNNDSEVFLLLKIQHYQNEPITYYQVRFHVCYNSQKGWTTWEMLLSHVEWSTLLTVTAAGPLPSTLLTTPKLEGNGIPTYSSPISTPTTPWWPTTPVRKCCTLGIAGIKSPIPSRLRNIRFITWSASNGKQMSWSLNALLFVNGAVLNRMVNLNHS